VPAEIHPVELAELVDFAERPRVQDWSLRAALVRYAQPEPQRVNDVLDCVRRIEWTIGKRMVDIQRDGPALWDALDGGDTAGFDAQLLGVLRAARAIDRLGDVLATWAVDRAGARPDAEVDEVVDDVAGQLDLLGVPREERQPPPRQRGV
jgi:hypothetical protein